MISLAGPVPVGRPRSFTNRSEQLDNIRRPFVEPAPRAQPERFQLPEPLLLRKPLDRRAGLVSRRSRPMGSWRAVGPNDV